MKVATVEQMRNLDRRAMEEYGIPGEVLMENASLAAYEVVREILGNLEGGDITVICGGGNNGGDGLALARKLYSLGSRVTVFILGDPSTYRKAAQTNYEIVKKLPIPLKRADSAESIVPYIRGAEVVVDAIFGTGLARRVEGLYKEIIRIINEEARYVVSLDIPSGVNGETGQVMGIAVDADETVTFGLPKIGNLVYPGYEYGGNLSVTHISFPKALTEREDILCEVNQPARLPERDPSGHKGSFGDALVISGSSSYYGAPWLSAYAFIKAGGGYARLACPQSIVPAIAGMGTEIVFLPQKENREGSIDSGNLDKLLELSEVVDIVILGPGMSRSEDTERLIQELVNNIGKPLIIDGDGLSAVAAGMDVLKNRTRPAVLTPHPGEFSRLTGKSSAEIEESAIPLLREFAQTYGCITLLKRAHTLTALPGGKVCINLGGNPGMATAGSGDVLTGTIAAMYGLGGDMTEAVKAGVCVHGLAGDLAARCKGEDGMVARDILEHLPEAVKKFREEYEVLVSGYYGNISLI